jgi:DNA-binding transcriptional regulator/RsmH inhibitor MraZ
MEDRTMLLTKQKLTAILENLRVSIPADVEKELLQEYGNLAVTEDGRVIEYSEQDIYEQLRKKVRSYENVGKEVNNFTLT